MNTTFVLIYFIGYICAYIFFRYDMITDSRIGGIWTKDDRLLGLFISLFSWCAFLSVLVEFLQRNYNGDERAKW